MENEEVKPTIEEPKVQEPVVEENAGEIDADALLSKLHEYNKTTPEEVDNMFKASQQAGNTARLLGEQREMTRQLQEQIESLKSIPKGNVEPDYNDYSGGQAVDLEKLISSAVGKELDNKIKSQQELTQKTQARIYADQQAVLNDRHYKDGNIRELFEQKLMDPNVQFQINSGRLSRKRVLDVVAHEYKDTLLSELGKKYEALSTPVAPHVEQGGRTSTNLVSGGKEQDPRTERLSELRKKANEGKLLSEEEELELITLV